MKQIPEVLRNRWALGVAVGQLIAILAAVSGSCGEAQGVKNLAMTQTVANYIFLALVNGFILLRSGKGLRNKWHHYAGIAFLDVIATYLTILSLRYTSVTSYTLITASNLFIVVPLSWWILNARYSHWHICGVLLSCLGVVVLFLTDKGTTPDVSGTVQLKDYLLGDTLVLFGALFYGVNAVWEEYTLQEEAPGHELLAMLGLFGSLFGGIAMLILGEWRQPVFPDPTTSWLRAGLVISMFAFYSFMPIVLAWSGATVLQMSLLGSNFWSVIARILLFDGFQGSSIWWFSVAFALVIGGVALFTAVGGPYKRAPEKVGQHVYRRLGEREANCSGDDDRPSGSVELTSSDGG